MIRFIHQREIIYNTLDLTLSLLLLVVCSPIFILAAILVKMDSPGSVIYTQERYGRNKKRFNIYKFRTMRMDAESDDYPVWGTESDPRCSPIGRMLRVSHIDELPQLVNVLKGEMSLVGPRPERPYFAEGFEISMPAYQRRYRVKPGLTGWSQVNGWRGNSSIEERTRCDLFYVRNRSIVLYIKILFMTFFTKPVKTVMDEYAAPRDYGLTFSQEEELCAESVPLSVPIRKA